MNDRTAFEEWWYSAPAEPKQAAWEAWQAAIAHARQQAEPKVFAYGTHPTQVVEMHDAAPVQQSLDEEGMRLLNRARWYVKQANDVCDIACAEDPDYCCADTLTAIEAYLAKVGKC